MPTVGESDSDRRLRELRQGGYEGWIDQDGRPAPCPICGQTGCSKDFEAHQAAR